MQKTKTLKRRAGAPAQTAAAVPQKPPPECLAILEARTAEGAFAAHHEVILRVERERRGIQEWLRRVQAANGFDPDVTLRRTPRPDARTFETACLPLGRLKEALCRSAADAIRDLDVDLDATLEGMVPDRQAGLAEWGAEAGACYFTFFTRRREVRGGPWRTLLAASDERRVEEWSHVTRHRHTLVGAKAWPLPAEHVGRPAWVEDLIEKMPERLRAEARVIDGTQVREELATYSTLTKSWTESRPRPVQERDPALVVRGYVLAGWSRGEAEEGLMEKRARRKTLSSLQRRERNRARLRVAAFLAAPVMLILLAWLAWAFQREVLLALQVALQIAAVVLGTVLLAGLFFGGVWLYYHGQRRDWWR